MRRGLSVTLVVAGAVLLLCGARPDLAAQSTPLRDGFWFGASGGYGRMNLPNCPSCEAAGMPVVSMRLGGKLSEHMLLGFEMSVTGFGVESGLPTLAVATATGYVYPSPRSGLHFKLGGGVAARDAYSSVDGVVAFGFVVGAGHDLRVAGNMSIVPSLSWLALPGSYSANVFQAAVGITLH